MEADRQRFAVHGPGAYTRPAFPSEHPFVCSGVARVRVVLLAAPTEKQLDELARKTPLLHD